MWLTVSRWLAENRTVVYAMFGLLAIVATVARFRSSFAPQRDPERAFSAAQRAEGIRRSGGQCEFDVAWFWRCGRPAQHADHWFPWSRGGVSSQENLVMACAFHNLRKSARKPSKWRTRRLAARRRAYFPPGVPVVPGERF